MKALSYSLSRLSVLAGLSLMLCSFARVPAIPADAADDLMVLLKAGNTREMAKVMNATVEITLLTEGNVYPKAQAEAMLKDFFAKHEPSAVKLVHKLTSNPNIRFTVVTLTTGNGVFRVSYSMKNTDGVFLLTEMRIEASKD